MRRRDFIVGTIGATVAWPFAAQAQQPAMPVVAYFSSGNSPTGRENLVDGFRKGLAQTGFIEGQNFTLVFRWAGDAYGQLPSIAADLVRQRAAVIVTPQLPSALAVKGATPAIPLVFLVGDDPIKHGLVASLNRPGGNATGMSMLAVGVAAKRLDLMRELVPEVPLIAVLVNPTNPNVTTELTEMRHAARAIGQRIEIFEAENTTNEIETAFASVAAAGARGLVVGADPFFNSHKVQIVHLAARYGMPGIYEWREFVEQGGLASYGTNLGEAMRELGIYVGRILKGVKPADLPVVQPTKFEFVINLRTAEALGLAIPPSLLARADEVIE
jgi:putative ABC transport system substrate-binding protein